MSIKNFLLRKMLARELSGVPQAEQEKIFAIIEKNPDLFQKIALEVQDEVKNGRGQMDAAMNIFKKYEKDLKSLM